MNKITNSTEKKEGKGGGKNKCETINKFRKTIELLMTDHNDIDIAFKIDQSDYKICSLFFLKKARKQ